MSMKRWVKWNLVKIYDVNRCRSLQVSNISSQIGKQQQMTIVMQTRLHRHLEAVAWCKIPSNAEWLWSIHNLTIAIVMDTPQFKRVNRKTNLSVGTYNITPVCFKLSCVTDHVNIKCHLENDSKELHANLTRMLRKYSMFLFHLSIFF